MDDFTLWYFVGDVSDVDNPRKFAVVALVEFNLRIHKILIVSQKLYTVQCVCIIKLQIIHDSLESSNSYFKINFSFSKL